MLTFLTVFVDIPEPSSSSTRSSFNQANREVNSSDLNFDSSLEDPNLDFDSSDWFDSDLEAEGSNYDEELDEEVQLEQVAMEDGTNEGFDNNVFHNSKF